MSFYFLENIEWAHVKLTANDCDHCDPTKQITNLAYEFS